MSPPSVDTEIAVIGGGPAGAAAAIHLARAGRDVTVLERTRGAAPKVCGEFLAAPALRELCDIGVDAAALGAVPLTRFRFSGRHRTSEAQLPFHARSLTRERLDETLLAVAADAGAHVMRGVRVRRALAGGGPWTVGLGGSTLVARHIVVASGKVDLRGHARCAGSQNGLAGLKAYLELTAEAGKALGDAVEILLFPGGYCGVEATEAAHANACLVLPKAVLQAGTTTASVMHGLAATGARAETLLAGATLVGRIQAIGAIPYGFVRRTSDGAFYVGDQAAVIPSFCGEGIGIALTSGRAAADALLAGAPANAFQNAFAKRVGRRVQAATVMSRLLCAPGWQGLAVRGLVALPGPARVVAAMVRTPAAADRRETSLSRGAL